MRNDADLQRDVQEELRWDPSIHAAEQIGVSVRNGVVELDGHVDSVWDKICCRARRNARRQSQGGRERNQSRPALSAIRTDEDIARAASNHLEFNALVPRTVQGSGDRWCDYASWQWSNGNSRKKRPSKNSCR